MDAKHAEQHLNEVKPDDVVNEAVEQIAYADRIVLNKTDLVEASYLGSLQQRLKAVNQMAAVERAQRGLVRPAPCSRMLAVAFNSEIFKAQTFYGFTS